MEIAVIAVIALIVLGPQKLPEAARSLGKGFREMRDSFQGTADHREELDEYEDEDDEFADEDDDVMDDDMVDDDRVDDEAEDEDDAPAAASEGERPSAADDHQNEPRSSVPSASSSSTERE
jgi:TatA/E family protein of Tat protein translocase